MENDTAEAERHFDTLTAKQQLKALWFGMRENQQIGQEIRLYQREQNGNVAKVVKDLDLHLKEHGREEIEMAFLKRWGGRGTAAILFLVALGNGVSIMAYRMWG